MRPCPTCANAASCRPRPSARRPLSWSERLGHGEGYQYAHDSPEGWVDQDYLGVERRYYEPVDRGFETEIARRLKSIRERRSKPGIGRRVPSPANGAFAVNSLGWTLVIAGIAIVVVGLFFVFGPAIPWLGRLPGDIRIEGQHGGFYFPITTCILLSVLHSAVAWVVRNLTR